MQSELPLSRRRSPVLADASTEALGTQIRVEIQEGQEHLKPKLTEMKTEILQSISSDLFGTVLTVKVVEVQMTVMSTDNCSALISELKDDIAFAKEAQELDRKRSLTSRWIKES
jgi:hypothetical protein